MFSVIGCPDQTNCHFTLFLAHLFFSFHPYFPFLPPLLPSSWSQRVKEKKQSCLNSEQHKKLEGGREEGTEEGGGRGSDEEFTGKMKETDV